MLGVLMERTRQNRREFLFDLISCRFKAFFLTKAFCLGCDVVSFYSIATQIRVSWNYEELGCLKDRTSFGIILGNSLNDQFSKDQF